VDERRQRRQRVEEFLYRFDNAVDEIDRDLFTMTRSLELKFGWLSQGPVT
jgi:hypothetical protein